MNTLALRDGFGGGLKTPKRWREGTGLDWLLTGGDKEEDPQLPCSAIPSMSLLVAGTTVASDG